MNKNENKKSKKKLFVLILFLFAVITLAGYGVYSYYSTTGNFTAGNGTIAVASFDPRVTIDSDSSFLGTGGEVTLTCSAYDNSSVSSSSSAVVSECDGELTITNNGGTTIYVSYSDFAADLANLPNDLSNAFGIDNIGYYDGYGLSFDGSSYHETDKVSISPGSSQSLYIHIGIVEYGGDAAEVTVDSPITTGQTFSATASFKLTASQSEN